MEEVTGSGRFEKSPGLGVQGREVAALEIGGCWEQRGLARARL